MKEGNEGHESTKSNSIVCYEGVDFCHIDFRNRCHAAECAMTPEVRHFITEVLRVP